MTRTTPTAYGYDFVSDADRDMDYTPRLMMTGFIAELPIQNLTPKGLRGSIAPMAAPTYEAGWELLSHRKVLLGVVLRLPGGIHLAYWYHPGRDQYFGGRRTESLGDAAHAVTCDAEHLIKDASAVGGSCVACPKSLIA
ncbi:hypothetical protein [Streptomyces sp. SM12]|uniref:hypothetical protein n=1 Tax=Streptomyces sp. SM12 TaxID=1071602 RepID=UPI000CD4F752|nr:hypothetical protein [Streptomyces sp. SM12]